MGSPWEFWARNWRQIERNGILKFEFWLGAKRSAKITKLYRHRNNLLPSILSKRNSIFGCRAPVDVRRGHADVKDRQCLIHARCVTQAAYVNVMKAHADIRAQNPSMSGNVTPAFGLLPSSAKIEKL